MAGVLISIIDLVWPHTFSTVLEVYYGTPYDRHVILVESSDVRYRKRTSNRGLEEPPGLGSRILRRLSSKARDQSNAVMQHRGSTASGSGVQAINGIENKGFQQQEAPKSPWRYPFSRSQQFQHPLSMQRTMSQDSGSSVNSAAIQISPLHKHALSRMLP